MASPSTRSSSRTEGHLTRRTRSVATLSLNQNNLLNGQKQSATNRKKRSRDADNLDDRFISAKRPKFVVEINSRLNDQPKSRSLVINSNASSGPVVVPPQLSAPRHAAIELRAPPPEPRQTIHHQKVANGIKHELDRLQPVQVDTKNETRKLRSQEGTRFKSELAAYFPEYDEVIGNEPKEDHILNLDTPIIIIDSAKPPTKQTPTSPKKNAVAYEYPLKSFPDSLFDDLYDAKVVDFSFLSSNYKDGGDEDPLSDEYFELIHRRPERHEKALRNTDKGRAQHEKDQVIRLLEGLQGPDWLKLMGVSGITDSRKKEYEPARAHFIKGCQGIIEKFRTWKEEEKRRKLEKELALAEAEEEEEGEASNVSDGDPPDYSDVDASAARQLHEEAIARTDPVTPSRSVGKHPKVEPPRAPEVEVEKEFKSFFAKPYLREAALGKHRRSGRSVAAWGHSVPELSESIFELPEEYRDEEFLKVRARKKRRDRRLSRE